MARVHEIDDDGGDPILKEVFRRQREMFGDLLNPTKVMAHCPPILRAAGAMGAAIEASDQLPAALRAMVYLRVATINGCPF
jgi:alkylhydroperoxidase family enzyme